MCGNYSCFVNLWVGLFFREPEIELVALEYGGYQPEADEVRQKVAHVLAAGAAQLAALVQREAFFFSHRVVK